MMSGTKIIGMWRDRDNVSDEHDADSETGSVENDMLIESDATPFSIENQKDNTDVLGEQWVDYGADSEIHAGMTRFIAPTLISLAAIVWTAVLLWSQRDIFTTIFSLETVIELITQWCMPLVLLGIIYLLIMRSSTKEVSRFTDAASALRAESELLETRLKTINNELTIAREFLAQESKELEFLGDQSAGKLQTAAAIIKSSLEDGLGNMRKLDEVGESAFGNLEQLREHLPVVINTAKDVTNQIGNSGRSAQAEMTAMLVTLQKIAEVGRTTKLAVDELTSRSNQSVENLKVAAEAMESNLVQQLQHAETGSERITSLLQQSARTVIADLQQARKALAGETAQAAQALKTDLATLEKSLEAASSLAAEEELRLKNMAQQLDEKITEIANNIHSLDNESGEKTAKLAFAMIAMEQNSNALLNSLENGHGAADGMIERVERLLAALDSSARELDEKLPAALSRISDESRRSLFLYDQIAKKVEKAGEAAGGVNQQISRTDESIDQQLRRLEKLHGHSGLTSDAILAQIEQMSTSLTAVQRQNDMLAESAGEKLIGALLRVKEAARQASEHSREALEKSITGSAALFEQQSEEMLDRIIQEKIGSVAPKLEAAVTNVVATANITAQHLAEQLSEIDAMATALEQRILFAKEKAEQSSEENFSRRVALLTESLNSTAIDVSKLLSNDVTDIEWAAYLKGDRGIFTRRAVRLLDGGEVREILSHYENDDEFRGHVNRYIHDFEAMLRSVLSTRDGSAISVTLLSSDIGKLYVALAQAIERLRN